MEANEVGHGKGLGGLVRSTTPEPLSAGTESEILGWFLDYSRAVLVRKAEGLTEAQARATVPPSSLTILGLVRHLAGVEEYWWTEMFLGREAILWVDDDDPDRDFHPSESDTLDDALAALRTQIAAGNATLEAAVSFDQLAVRERRGNSVSLRWIVVHLIEEYSRHCGHADFLREAIDGLTGD